jgi:hypothetical protein
MKSNDVSNQVGILIPHFLVKLSLLERAAFAKKACTTLCFCVTQIVTMITI